MPALHEDPEWFREAVNFTAAVTAFAARLIEKDYFCTLLLGHLATVASDSLVFKGGTCLAKVYARFYRLSEDLDFVIPMPIDATRGERRQQAARVKEAVMRLGDLIPAFRVVEPMKGANNSTQYVAEVGYMSLLRGQQETIKIEVGLREPLVMRATPQEVQTLLLDPVSHAPMVPTLSMPCIAKMEAFAEKFRAALSRREVAIRDFFDIDYAVQYLGLKPDNVDLAGLVCRKLAVPGNESVDVSAERLVTLGQQLHSQLKPVLREKDFAAFDLARAFKIVVSMAKRLTN